MEQIDGSVIATALPRISQSLRTDPVHLNLAITAYMFSLAVFIPLSGWIADRFGARNVFRLAVVIFVAGSIACGFSNSLWELVAARVLQGTGGAMMVPVGRLVLLRTIPKKHLVDAMATMTAPALLGPILGPPIGGIIVTFASWRWIFLINVPIGILGYILATRYFGDLRGRKREPLDFHGFVLMALFLSGLIFGAETVGRNAVSDATIYCIMGGGILCLVLYLLRTRRISHPIVDLRPLHYRTYRAAITGGSLFRISIGAMPFLLPLMLQYGFGMTPAMSGFVTLAGAAGAVVMKIIAKPIIRAIGFRPLLIGNMMVNAAFFAVFACITGKTSMGLIFAFLLARGLFASLQFTAMNAVAFADIPDYLLSRANTLYNMMQQLTLSLGVACGALALNYSLRWRGSTALAVQDFWPVYVGLTVLCLLSVTAFLPLARNAGAVVCGRELPAEEAVHKDPA